jgi:hypothetical protein
MEITILYSSGRSEVNLLVCKIGYELEPNIKTLFICITNLQTVSYEVIEFFNLSNLLSNTKALVFTQSLTEMNTRNLTGSDERPGRNADNLIAICEPII